MRVLWLLGSLSLPGCFLAGYERASGRMDAGPEDAAGYDLDARSPDAMDARLGQGDAGTIDDYCRARSCSGIMRCSEPSCSLSCESGTDPTSDAGVRAGCTFDCGGAASCDVRCGEGRDCQTACLGSERCTTTCASGAECSVACGESACGGECRPGARCAFDCRRHGCTDVVCRKEAACTLLCGEGECSFAVCEEREQRRCGDGRLVVCGRACPSP